MKYLSFTLDDQEEKPVGKREFSVSSVTVTRKIPVIIINTFVSAAIRKHDFCILGLYARKKKGLAQHGGVYTSIGPFAQTLRLGFPLFS